MGICSYQRRLKDGVDQVVIKGEESWLIYPECPPGEQENFWCDVGTDSPHDPALAGEMERTMSLLRDEVRESS